MKIFGFDFSNLSYSKEENLKHNRRVVKNLERTVKNGFSPDGFIENQNRLACIKYSARDFVNSLGDLLPRKLISSVIRKSGVPERIKISSVTKEMRARLVATLKAYPLTPVSFRPIDEAIVTCGGVSVKEIDPKTMMSKKVSGLFVAGELLDLDAYTGGYNLQIAWSTGKVAGESAAEYAFGIE